MNCTHCNTSWLPLIGRIFIAGIFIFTAFMKILNFDMMVGYASSVSLPIPVVAIIIAIIIELLGGIALLVGYKTRLTAHIIAIFLVIVTLFFHTKFGQGQLPEFLKNISLIGGLLYIAANGAGTYSLDSLKNRQ